MVVLTLTIIGLLKKDIVWAVFPALGGIIGLMFSVALLADGSLTLISGGVSSVIASASIDVASIWQAIGFIPVAFTITAFLISIYKVGIAFD